MIENSGKKRTINNIHKIIDDIENRLNTDIYDINSNYLRNNNNYNDYNMSYPYINRNINIQPQPQLSDVLNESIVRRIVKEEFQTLIVDYQKDMLNQFHMMESKMNKNNIQIKELLLKTDDNKSLNDRNSIYNNKINNNYVLKNEYDYKMNEIDSILQSFQPLIQFLKEKLNDKVIMNNNNDNNINPNANIEANSFINKNDFELEIKKLKDTMDEIIKKYNNINSEMYNIKKNMIELNNDTKNTKIDIEGIKNNLKDVKLKSKPGIDSNSFMKLFSLNVDAIKPLIYNNNCDTIKNSVDLLNNKIKNLEQIINEEKKNNFDNVNNILQTHRNDINQLKEEFKKECNNILQTHRNDINQIKEEFKKECNNILQNHQNDFNQIKENLKEQEDNIEKIKNMINSYEKNKMKGSIINSVNEMPDQNDKYDNDFDSNFNNNKNNNTKKSRYKVESMNDI
jgi:hypothetical protein